MDKKGGIQKKSASSERTESSQEAKERRRAHAGDFERQVEQIRKEAELVKANLDAAGTALDEASQLRSKRHNQAEMTSGILRPEGRGRVSQLSQAALMNEWRRLNKRLVGKNRYGKEAY